MKTRLKKTLSVLLTLCMILSVMSSSLIAVAEPSGGTSVTGEADGAAVSTDPAEGDTEDGVDGVGYPAGYVPENPGDTQDEISGDTAVPGDEQDGDVDNDIPTATPVEDYDPSYDEGEGDGFLPGEPEEGEGEDYGIMLTLANAASGMMWSVNGSNPIETPYRARNLSGMVAFDFHVFAKYAHIVGHCHGNIAVEELLEDNSTFGLHTQYNGLSTASPLSYVGAASDLVSSIDASKVVFGSQTVVSTHDNGNKASVPLFAADNLRLLRDDSGKYIPKMSIAYDGSEYQSYVNTTLSVDDVYVATDGYIDIDAGLSAVKDFSDELNKKIESAGIEFFDDHEQNWNNAYVDISAAPNPAVWNISYDELKNLKVLTIKGMESGKTLIVNVTGMPAGDAEAHLTPEIKINGGAQNGEDIVAWDGNLIWNFDTFAGTVYTEKAWLGTMLVPYGKLDTFSNTNGSLIAETVTIRGESHKWDYNGFDTTNVSGSKTWVLPAGYTPDQFAIKVNLYRTYYRNGVQVGGPQKVDERTITGDGDYLFDNLEASHTEYNADGSIKFTAYYRYEVEEEVIKYPEGVNLEDIVSQPFGYNFVNTVKGNGDSTVSGTKTWVAPEGTELPESITVTLYQNGRIYNDPSDPDFKNPQIVTKDNGWHYEWTNLPTQDKNGLPYTYYVDEDVPDGWIKTIDGYNIINTKDGTPRGSLKVVKKVTGDLNATDEEIQNKVFTFTVTGPNGYSGTVTVTGEGESAPLENLIPGEYTVTEQGADVDGYTCVVTGGETVTVEADLTATAEVTNTYTAKLGSLKVVKTVAGDLNATDEEIQNKVFTFTVTGPDGSDYEETVTLKAGETKTLDNLVPGTYTVTEVREGVDVEGYTCEVTGEGTVTVAPGADVTVPVTNTYTKKFGSLKVVKTVTGDLSGDSEEIKDKVFTFTVTGPEGSDYEETVTLKAGETKTLDNLVPGTYTVTELREGIDVDGYTCEVTGDGEITVAASKDTTSAEVTNKYTKLVGSLKIIKTVAGDLNATDEEIQNKVFTFTVTGPDGYTAEVTITGAGKRELTGLAIGEYNVTETGYDIEGYSCEVTGGGEITVSADKITTVEVINTYTEEKENKTHATVNKVWVDDSKGTEKTTPNQVVVKLIQKAPDGSAKVVKDDIVLNAENNWTVTITDLEKYVDIKDTSKGEYSYSFDEVDVPEGWTKKVTNSGTSYTITNTRKLGSIELTKTVVGLEIADAKTFTFDVKGPEGYVGEIVINISDNGIGTGKLENLVPGEYTITERDASVEGYALKVEGDKTVTVAAEAAADASVTNTYTALTTVSGTKTWVDASNDNKAPDTSITVQLLRDGEVIDSKTVTATDNWKYEFTNLPKTDAEGKAYTYTVDEVEVPGWTKNVSGYNITNTREVVSVSGTKTWVDASNDNKAPDTSITVQLLRDGTVIDSKTVTAADNWKYEFTNLPKTDAEGKAYTYTVDEVEVPGWTKNVSGYNITNTREVVSVSGTKTWVDASNDNKAPDTSITVQLLRDGTVIDSKTVTAADNWKYEFTNLPKTDAEGHDYEYTVDETAIPGWTKSITGYNITNTRTVVSVEGTKTWHSATGANTPVPDSYSVDVVVKNGETEVGRKTLSNANGWDYKFENLPEYDAAGNKISYTVSEENAPEHWTSNVDGYNISNTMEGTEITAAKTWNTRGLSVTVPESVTLKVLADGEETGITIELSEANGWSATRGGLNKYDITDGHEIKYTVEEVPITGWTPSYDGNNLTNTYDVTSVTAKKVWNKADGTPADAADEIPASVQVDVLADGVLRDTMTLMASNGWTSTLGNLPKYAEDGDEIEYTVKEHTVDGWVSAVTNDGNVYTVTNTKKVPEKGAITLTKQVIGGGAAAADKEYSFEINGPDGYSQTVTVTGAGSISLTDLEPGEYTVTEVGGRIGGYRLDVTGDNTTVTVEADGEANVVITNEYTELRDVAVTKEWYVNGSRTNAPAGASITVSLYADGVATGDSAILSQYTDWKAEFTGLDVYDEDGNEIRYTVAEVYVSGWTSTVVGTADTGFVIRNYSTYTPPHEPEQPDQPDEPEQPDEPDEPETPETPETPDTPHEPEQPRQPEQPREPERPFTPEMPETPEVPFYDIPDSEVPLTHITDSKTPLVDIPDLGVPLRALPATGDESHTVVWMAIMVCSAFGIIVLAAVLYFDGKKNKKREESAE